jgi:signal transduction histidine kinase/ActR/RegA family two-component response regulator
MESSSASGGGQDRLKRCVRDLAALTALPSLCIGRTPNESLDVLIDALPTALGCDLVYFLLPGQLPQERIAMDGAWPAPDQMAEIRAISADASDGAAAAVFVAGERLWCLEAEVPMGAQRGRLLAGRRMALDPETDRVLIRSAANLIGTIIETANVLEVARRKDNFLAMLGHELRNPLAPIVTAVDLMKLNTSVARERDVIERHTHHLVRIVDDLLDISRVTRGHIELRRESVMLASVLQRAVEMASPLITRSRHQLEVAEAHGATLQGDPIRLAQIFGNLLTNAAKFTPPAGRIDVLVEKSGGRVRVTVQDNGAGIAADQLKRIFEPFVQADRARDELRGGLGLGLAIVKSLVEHHGGSIAVHSEGRGRGAAFTVDLPLSNAVLAQPSIAGPQPSQARAQVRVLVVDDNTDIAELLSEALQNQGFQTAVASDGRDALSSWRSFLPHAGVLDVGLPDVDGYEVARTIRSEYGAGAVLIAVTGYGQPGDRVRSSNAGFDCHFVKPVSLAELVKVLDQRVVPGKD